MTSSRRSFIKHAVFLPYAISLTQCKTVGRAGVGSSSFLKVSPTNNYLPKRVSWSKLSAAEKTAFTDAIKLMQDLDVDVPDTFGEGGARKLKLWTAQAEVHNWYCPHWNWSFLPWHRAYLYHFELMLRKLTKNDNFRLPYWDWSVDKEVPEEFRDSKSEFLTKLGVDPVGRNATVINDGAAGEMGTSQWWSEAFQIIDSKKIFDDVGGELDSEGTIENPYHNRVHVAVGGSMQSVAVAALDPVFWLHHCNVDRLWSAWTDARIAEALTKSDVVEAGAGKSPRDQAIQILFPSEDVGAWLAEPFSDQFWVISGEPNTPNFKASLTSATVKTSLLTEDMGYNYDGIKNTWTISDIPTDLPLVKAEPVIESVETTPPTLRLADPSISVLALKFTLPASVYNGPQKLLSLRLKLGGIPVPTDTTQTYDVKLIVQGKVLALQPLVFFASGHNAHKERLLGVSLNNHLELLQGLAEGKRTVQLVLTLKDKGGKSLPIPNPETNPRLYKVKVKAVFK